MNQNAEARHTGPPSASHTPHKPGLFYGYIVVGAAALIMLVLFGAQYSFGIFFKPMLEQFGWSRALTSGVYSLNCVIQGFFTMLAGRLNDRFGPRIVITFSGLLVLLGYVLMSRVNAVWQIYLFYGVFISLGSCAWVPLVSTSTRWFIARRGMMSGIISAGIGCGMVIFPPVANWLIAGVGWRHSYTIMGVFTAVVMLLAAQLLRRDPTQKGLLPYGAGSGEVKESDSPTKGYTLGEAIRTRQFWIICMAFFTTNFCVQTVVVHMVPHATDIGIGPAAAATVISAVGVLSIMSKVGIGVAIDRVGGKRVLVALLAILAISFLWLLPADRLWMLFVFAVIFASGYGGSSAVQSPIIAEYFGIKAHGTIMGTLLIGNFLGGAVSPSLAGRIFDTTESYRWAFIICVVVCLASFVSTLLLKPPPRKV